MRGFSFHFSSNRVSEFLFLEILSLSLPKIFSCNLNIFLVILSSVIEIKVLWKILIVFLYLLLLIHLSFFTLQQSLCYTIHIFIYIICLFCSCDTLQFYLFERLNYPLCQYSEGLFSDFSGPLLVAEIVVIAGLMVQVVADNYNVYTQTHTHIFIIR